MDLNSNDVAGMFAMLIVFGIPIVGILTSHQRKMAKLLHEQAMQASALSPDAQSLREEIRELRSLVHQQAIALDSLSRPVPTEARLQERVG